MTSYFIYILTIGGIYAMLSLGLVTIWGQGGMVNIGLVGFFALGAYASALLTKAGSPIWLGWILGSIFAGAAGVVLTYATRKMRGDYLAIVSLGFAEVVRLVAMNEIWLTNGSDGVSGIKAPFKAELGDHFNSAYMVVVWLVVAIAAVVLTRLLRAPFGRALRAIKDDEQVAAVAGKPVLKFKLKSFFIGACITGLAGAMYAHLTSYIAPDSFVPLLTIYIFLGVTLGGNTRIKGALVGALIVVSLLEVSRFTAALIPGLNAVQVAAIREMSIALTLIIVMQVRSNGLFAPMNERAGSAIDVSSSGSTLKSAV
ncbi:MAG: branched-chain amino acid transporter permease [Herminiimonas sp.]|nr:branched-chain amino acid transporter permease [Herminiimonas sp.]